MAQRKPNQRKPSPRPSMDEKSESTSMLEEGDATEMWLELIPYSESEEGDDVRSLWLLVNETWLKYDLEEGDDYIEKAVLSAFSTDSDRLQVRVWYYVDQSADGDHILGSTDPKKAEKNYYGTTIVGLVVHSRY